MPTDVKKDIVKSLREKISKARSIILADYQGITANQINELRNKLKADDCELSISKNTLLKIALDEEKVVNKELEEHLKGPNAAIFGYKDPISPIKIITEFAKKLEFPKIKAAIVEGRFINAQLADELSKLPSKEVLISQFIGGIKSPILGLVNVLNGIQRKFVGVLSSIKDKKGGV